MRIVTKLTLYNPNDPTNPDNLRLSFCIYFIASSVIVAICAVLLIIVTRAKYVTYYMELAQKQPKQDQKKAAMLPVIGKVWYLGIYAAVTYLTGKTVYPGLVTIIPSVLGPNMQEWLPVILTVRLFIQNDISIVYVQLDNTHGSIHSALLYWI